MSEGYYDGVAKALGFSLSLFQWCFLGRVLAFARGSMAASGETGAVWISEFGFATAIFAVTLNIL